MTDANCTEERMPSASLSQMGGGRNKSEFYKVLLTKHIELAAFGILYNHNIFL